MRLRHRLGRPALLGLGAIVAALAAAVSATAGSGAASDPIKLMVIAPVQTPIQNYPDAFTGAQAAADGAVARACLPSVGEPVELAR